MKKVLLLFLLISTISIPSYSQFKNFRAKIESQASVTTSDHIPFWMRSNQFGSIPLSGPSASLIGAGYKDYDTTNARLVDWGAGVEARVNGGERLNLTLIEGYLKGKLGIFELKGGRMKETFGLTDTLLTTGNFSLSGNALGIPKIQLAIPEYYAVPIFRKLFAIKGVFAQGWLGNVPIQDKRVTEAVTYFHQKAFYIRIGQPDWKIAFYGGFNDQVFYGHEKQIFESFTLTNWQKYQSVVFGKSWAHSKVGNHTGNLDLRIEYDFPKFKLTAYRQSFYEVGALYHLANIADGINGLSIENMTNTKNNTDWKKFLFEFLYTKNQAGESWSKPTPTGDENYLNHYMYKEGWSYNGLGLGTPFITAANQARPGQAFSSKNYFINNRVSAVHIGAIFSVRQWDVLSKLSYSHNFGIHRTSETFHEVNQFSALIDGRKMIKNDFEIGFRLAADIGHLLPSSQGIALRLVKHFH